jgi:hypothetical protein
MLKRRQEGTGQWLLNSAEYTNCCRGAASILYCYRMPGAGETVIVSLIAEHLSSTCKGNSDKLIAYLYCNYRRKDEQKPTDLFANILNQSILQQPSMPALIERLHTKCHRHKIRPPSKVEALEQLHTVATATTTSKSLWTLWMNVPIRKANDRNLQSAVNYNMYP